VARIRRGETNGGSSEPRLRRFKFRSSGFDKPGCTGPLQRTGRIAGYNRRRWPIDYQSGAGKSSRRRKFLENAR
jgi:hypothetical protein